LTNFVIGLLSINKWARRVNISNANIFGLSTDLHIATGNKYNTALVIFFVPYVLFEIPSNVLLKKLKPMVGEHDAPILTLPPNYNRGWRDDLEAAKIPYETPAGLAVVHSLRKSFTTLVQELAGASLSEAQKLARHSTPTLTSNIYTKSSQSKLLSLVDCLGERLLA